MIDPIGSLLLAIVLALITLFSLVGNCLVIFAIVKCHRLRNQLCYHILAGLAIADVCVSILVMPWSIAYLYLGHWPFGSRFCNFWMSCDVMCCTASLLHLCLVAMDRYAAIGFPFAYERIVNALYVRIAMIIIWILSSVISFIPVHLEWYKNSHATDKAKTECELSVNPGYAVVSSIVSFYAPFLLSCALYGRILCITLRQSKNIRIKNSLSSIDDQPIKAHNCYGSSSSDGTTVSPTDCWSHNHAPVRPSDRWQKIAANSQIEGQTSCENSSRMTETKLPVLARVSVPSHSSLGYKIDLKAIRTIGLLLSGFVLCWLPFFVAYVILAFCPRRCPHPRQLMRSITWIGYGNSSLNPIFYAFMQREFRRAFAMMFKKTCGIWIFMQPKLIHSERRKSQLN